MVLTHFQENGEEGFTWFLSIAIKRWYMEYT